MEKKRIKIHGKRRGLWKSDEYVLAVTTSDHGRPLSLALWPEFRWLGFENPTSVRTFASPFQSRSETIFPTGRGYSARRVKCHSGKAWKPRKVMKFKIPVVKMMAKTTNYTFLLVWNQKLNFPKNVMKFFSGHPCLCILVFLSSTIFIFKKCIL